MAQVPDKFSAILSTIIDLKLEGWFTPRHSLTDLDHREWLHLLHQFPAVQAQCVSREFAGPIVCALTFITAETVAEALLYLGLICLEGQPASSIKTFIIVRRPAGRPVTVVGTEAEFDQRLESYIRK